MPSVERINCHSEHWANRRLGEDKAKVYYAGMDEGRKRVIGVMAAILATGEAFFGGTTWRKRRAMRISVCNWHTSAEDVQRVVRAVAKVLSA